MTRGWISITSPGNFNRAFIQCTFVVWKDIPMRFILIGMALSVSIDPYTPRTLSEYADVGRMAWFDPIRAVFGTMFVLGTPTVLIASMMREPWIWRFAFGLRYICRYRLLLFTLNTILIYSMCYSNVYDILS